MKYSKEQLIDLLRTNAMTVTFTKADGSTRVMKCTLADQYVQTYFADKNQNSEFLSEVTEAQQQLNPKTVTVWDLEASAWRSFNIERVINVAPGPVLLND